MVRKTELTTLHKLHNSSQPDMQEVLRSPHMPLLKRRRLRGNTAYNDEARRIVTQREENSLNDDERAGSSNKTPSAIKTTDDQQRSNRDLHRVQKMRRKAQSDSAGIDTLTSTTSSSCSKTNLHVSDALAREMSSEHNITHQQPTLPSLESLPAMVRQVTYPELAEQSQHDITTLLAYRVSKSLNLPSNYHDCLFQTIGNTCFANIVLFGLCDLYRVRHLCHQHAQKYDNPNHLPTRGVCRFCTFASDTASLTCRHEQKIRHTPALVLAMPEWCPLLPLSRHHDVTEFWEYMFTALNKDIQDEYETLFADVCSMPARYTTPFWKMIGYSGYTLIKCTTCGQENLVHWKKEALRLPIVAGAHVHLTVCIHAYFRTTPLQDTCDNRCQRFGTRMQQEVVAESGFPSILTIILKRWHANHSIQKDSRHVQFPFELARNDLPGYNGAAIYALRSVVVHDGATGAGHYTAYSRCNSGDWFYYNDSDTSTPRACSKTTVSQAEAFMLFYESQAAR